MGAGKELQCASEVLSQSVGGMKAGTVLGYMGVWGANLD